MSCQWEAFTGKPCHRPARKLKDAEKGYNILEEKLANASMLRSLLFGNSRLRVPGKMEALKMFTEKQPEGYRDGKLCSKHEDFLGNSEHLMCEYINCIDGYDIQFLNAIHLAELFKFPPKIDWRYCPIHILHDEDEFDIPSVEISLFRRITGIS